MKERQISLACVKNAGRRLFRRKIFPNIRDEGTQTILAPRPRATGVKSVIKYSSPAISSWYILGKSFHTMVDFRDCYWGQCSDFVTNSCSESWDSDCEKLLVPVQNHQVPVQKTTNPKLKMLGPLCNQTVNLNTWQSPKLCITVCSPSILNTTKAKWNMHRSTTAIITATVMNRIFLQKDMFRSIDRSSRPTGRMPWSILRLWGFLCQGRRTQDAEVTKPLGQWKILANSWPARPQ